MAQPPNGASAEKGSSALSSGDEILRFDALHKSFGGLKVLDGVSLGVAKGEVVVLIGRSGSGKSTFLRCVNLLELPDSGTLTFEDWSFTFARGRHPGGADMRRLRRQIGMVFQQFNLWPHMTAEANVMLALRDVLGFSKQEARERAMNALAKVGLSEKARSLPGHLSGGQQQRVALARSIALEPKLIMFDEVTSALDPELVQDVLSEIRMLAESGMTMVVVTHEMQFAREVGDRVVFMNQGAVVEQGPARQVITQPSHPETRAFLRSIIS